MASNYLTFNLNAYANQEFSTTVGENSYRVRLCSFRGFTLADIYKNDEPLVLGAVCLPNKPITPYEYMNGDGFFQFDCIDKDYPYYTKFNSTQFLRFYFSE